MKTKTNRIKQGYKSKHSSEFNFCIPAIKEKQVFQTENAAKRLINKLRVKNESTNILLRSYYCTYCEGWHITHKPKWK